MTKDLQQKASALLDSASRLSELENDVKPYEIARGALGLGNVKKASQARCKCGQPISASRIRCLSCQVKYLESLEIK